MRTGENEGRLKCTSKQTNRQTADVKASIRPRAPKSIAEEVNKTHFKQQQQHFANREKSSFYVTV